MIRDRFLKSRIILGNQEVGLLRLLSKIMRIHLLILGLVRALNIIRIL